jgi:hypothetical protein
MYRLATFIFLLSFSSLRAQPKAEEFGIRIKPISAFDKFIVFEATLNYSGSTQLTLWDTQPNMMTPHHLSPLGGDCSGIIGGRYRHPTFEMPAYGSKKVVVAYLRPGRGMKPEETKFTFSWYLLSEDWRTRKKEFEAVIEDELLVQIEKLTPEKVIPLRDRLLKPFDSMDVSQVDFDSAREHCLHGNLRELAPLGIVALSKPDSRNHNGRLVRKIFELVNPEDRLELARDYLLRSHPFGGLIFLDELLRETPLKPGEEAIFDRLILEGTLPVRMAHYARWPKRWTPEQEKKLLKEIAGYKAPTDSAKLRELVEQLDSQRRRLQPEGYLELVALGECALEGLRKEIARPELNARVRDLLEKAKGEIISGSADRLDRELIEWCKNTRTRQVYNVYEALMQGSPEAWIVQEANLGFNGKYAKPLKR